MSSPVSRTPENQPVENTDRELWRERDGDYYADSIHVTKGGGLGINCGGYVIVKPVREWFKLAAAKESLPTPPSADMESSDTPESKVHPTGVTFEKWISYQPYKPIDGTRFYTVETVRGAWNAGLTPSSSTASPAHDQDTPRVERNKFLVGKDEVVYASFAACLEREINTLRKSSAIASPDSMPGIHVPKELVEGAQQMRQNFEAGGDGWWRGWDKVAVALAWMDGKKPMPPSTNSASDSDISGR